MRIGVDLGNYAVKTSMKDSFLSKVTTKEGFNSTPFYLDYDKFYVEEGEFSTDYNKAEKDITIQLLYYALAKYDANIFDIVVSLPISQYKAKKQGFEQLIRNNNAKTVSFGNITKDIIIDKILVMPEGASAIYNLSKEQKEIIGTKQLLIVDVGGRTTDVALFINNKIKDVKTVSTGSLTVYEEIVEEVNNKFITDFKLEDGEELLKNGLFLKGKQQDLRFIVEILKRHFNAIYKELQLKFNLDLGYVFLTGGGSYLFRKAFKNRLSNVLLSNDPIFDNAIGSLKAGERIWQE